MYCTSALSTWGFYVLCRYGPCIIIRGWAFGKSSGNLAVVRGVHLIGYGSRVWMEYGRGVDGDGGSRSVLHYYRAIVLGVSQERLCDHLAGSARYQIDMFD